MLVIGEKELENQGQAFYTRHFFISQNHVTTIQESLEKLFYSQED